MRDKFEQLVRDTCHTDEHTFKLDGGAYFRTTYAKTYDGLPPREMASVQTMWNFYQAGAAHQRQQAREVVMPDVSAMAKVLSDRAADACNINRDDNWAMYGQEYIDDVQAMLGVARLNKGAGSHE